MSNKRYWVLPLAAAGLLGVALVASRWMDSQARAGRGEEAQPEAVGGGAPQPEAALAVGRAGAAQPAPSPAQAEALVSLPVAEAQGPQLPPEAGAAPHDNDPLLPEQPQTPEWRHQKLTRMAALLERDVERLAQQQAQAAAQGQAEEAQRLGLMVARQRARLQVLQTEAEALAGQDERMPLK